MNRTTVMLPEDLKIKAAQIASKRGISLGELVREALETICGDQIKDKRDCFFVDRDFYDGKTPKDLAKHHDDYLYEDK